LKRDGIGERPVVNGLLPELRANAHGRFPLVASSGPLTSPQRSR